MKEKDFEKKPVYATFRGILTFFLFGCIPYLIVMWIDDPSIIPVNVDFLDISSLKDLLMRSVYMSPILAVVSFLAHYFPMSSRMNVTSRMLQIAVSIVYLIYVTNYGKIGDIVSLSISDINIDVGMTLTFMLVIMIVLKLLDLPIIYADYKDYRESDPKFKDRETKDFVEDVEKRDRGWRMKKK